MWMKCFVSNDVGTWTNWLTFEPDPHYSPDAETGLLSPMSYKRCDAEFYVGKIQRIRIGGPPLQRGVVLKWFIHWAVETPLSEVHALYRVTSSLFVNLGTKCNSSPINGQCTNVPKKQLHGNQFIAASQLMWLRRRQVCNGGVHIAPLLLTVFTTAPDQPASLTWLLRYSITSSVQHYTRTRELNLDSVYRLVL